MSDRRQAHRREPITVTLDDGREFDANPLPWMVRNDLGNEVVRQATQSLNEFVKIYTEPELNIPQLEAKLDERLIDPGIVLHMAYPNAKDGEFDDLVYSELIELIFAALDVNGLERLKRTIDPNSLPPTEDGGTRTSEVGEIIGARLVSMLGSSSPESPEQKSLDSPTEKSSESLEKSKSEPGTTEDGA